MLPIDYDPFMTVKTDSSMVAGGGVNGFFSNYS